MIKTLSALFLLPLLFINSGVGENADSFFIKKEPEQVTSSKTIYVDVSDNEKFLEEGSNPIFKYHTDVDYTVSLIPDKNDIYKTESTIPAEVFTTDTYGFEISCFDGTYKTAFMKGVATSLKETDYDYLMLNSFVSGKNAEVKGYGIYKEKTPNPDPTYKTQRVWLSDNIKSDVPYELAVSYSYNDELSIIVMKTIMNSKNGQNYFYADIPYELRTVTFLRMNTAVNHNYIVLQATYIQLSFGVCYFSGDKYEDFTKIYSDNVVDADYVILGMVVEAYLTYGKDVSNGSTHSTVTNLDSTWFKQKAATSDDLKQNTILDYSGYSKNGNSYEGLTKDAKYSIDEKWNTMKSQAGINSGSNLFSNLFSSDKFFIVLIAGLSSIVIVGVVALMFVETKLKHRKPRH